MIDYFKIKVENNNSKQITDFLEEKGYCEKGYFLGAGREGGYYYGDKVNRNYVGYTSNGNVFAEYPEYTLNEFKKAHNQSADDDTQLHQSEFERRMELLNSIELLDIQEIIIGYGTLTIEVMRVPNGWIFMIPTGNVFVPLPKD